MNVFDIVLGLILLLFFAFGFKKGLVSSVLNLIGFAGAFVLIGRYGPLIQISFVEKFSLTPMAATILSYVIIFVIIMIIAKIIAYFATKLVKALNLSFANYVLGGILGLLNGGIGILMFVIIVNVFPFAPDVWSKAEGSFIVKYARKIAAEVEVKLLEEIPQTDLIEKVKESL